MRNSLGVSHSWSQGLSETEGSVVLALRGDRN